MRILSKKSQFNFGSILLFSVVAYCANRNLFPISAWLHDSDLCINPLAAEHMLRGEWRPFPFRQDYGGTLLTTYRAVWLSIFDFFSFGTHLNAHAFFSYVVIPWTLAISFFFALKNHFSDWTRLVLGVLIAFNFQSWIHLEGNDFYFSFLALAPWFFYWRSNLLNPFLELKPYKLFYASALTGFTLYTWRAGLVYAVAFLFPWELLIPFLRRITNPKDRIEKFLLGGILFFVAFYVYLEFFGPKLGLLPNGKELKIHSGPNLRFAFVLFVIYWVRIYRNWILSRRDLASRVGILISGFALGFLPEWLFFLWVHRLPFNWVNSTLGQSLQTSLTIPRAFQELMLGWTSMTYSFSALQNISLLLLWAGLLLLTWVALWTRSSKFLPIWMTGIVAVAAYCRVYMSGPAESRYLFPIFPVILVSIGLLVEKAKPYKLATTFVLLFLFGHLTDHWLKRQAMIDYAVRERKVEQMYDLIAAVEKLGVKSVVSDHYWKAGYQYSLLTQEKILFAPIHFGAKAPLEAFDLALTEKRIGIVWTEGPLDPKNATLFGSRFEIKFIEKVNGYYLYEGTRSPVN